MENARQIVLGLICLTIILLGINAAVKYLKARPTQKSVTTMAKELQNQGSIVEKENESLLEHESNGPEGAQGIAMQRASAAQTAFAMIVLLLAASLVLCKKESRSSTGN